MSNNHFALGFITVFPWIFNTTVRSTTRYIQPSLPQYQTNKLLPCAGSVIVFDVVSVDLLSLLPKLLHFKLLSFINIHAKVIVRIFLL